jgi:hypothetical protein
MSINPLNDISAVYVQEVFKPQLGKQASKPEGTKKVEKGKEDAESSAKRIRQATYDIRYRARREDLKLDQAFSQYMGHTTMTGPEKSAVKEKLGLTDGGGGGGTEVKEEVDGKKFKVRVTDKESGKSYVRYATREKINQLRSNPNISSVEMTGYGSPYEGEKKKGEKTAAVKSGKGLDPVGREDKDIDNDGDHDKTDKYLLNRRKVRGSAISKRDVKEGFSNWRDDLSEVFDVVDKEDNEKKITGMKSGQKNKIKTSAMGGGINFKESVESMGGQLLQMEEVELDEKAPPGAKFERMVKHIKKGYSKDGLTDKEKSIAYATAWKAKNKETNEEIEIEEGMTLKDFKKKRSAVKQKEKRAAEKIAPGRRAGIHADKASPERAARHRANVDPDFEGNDERNYPGGKLNPKKVRKAKALGELGEQAAAPMDQKKQSAQPQQSKPNPMDKKLAAIQKTQLAAKLKQVQQGIPLKDSYEIEEVETVSELNRYEKEKGINTKTNRPTQTGGAKDDKAFTSVKRMMRGMEGTPKGQQKKVPGKKPPTAGQYGAPKSPAQKVAARRASAQRAQDNMSSRFD